MINHGWSFKRKFRFSIDLSLPPGAIDDNISYCSTTKRVKTLHSLRTLPPSTPLINQILTTDEQHERVTFKSLVSLFEAEETMMRVKYFWFWVHLERIEYIQRSSAGEFGRSAWNSRQARSNTSNEFSDRSARHIEIYYSTDHPRSEYLYKRAAFYSTLSGALGGEEDFRIFDLHRF